MRACLTYVLMLLAGSWGAGVCSAADERGERRGRGGSEYDVLQEVRIATFADLIRDMITAGAEKDLAQPKPGESSADYEIRAQFTRGLVRSVNRTIGDVEDVQLGWRLDRPQKRTYADLNVNARRSSQLADQVAQLADQRTQFGGFRQDGAVLNANWLGQAAAEDAQANAVLVDAVRDKALQDIDAESVSPEEKAIRKELVRQLFDVLRMTAASGRGDGALALRIDGKRLTLVAGSYIADGKQLEKVVKPVGQFLQQNHPAFASLRLDAETVGDIGFHTLALPAPVGNDREKFHTMFGDQLEVVVGFGKEAVYFAAGWEALPALKRAIQQSEQSVVPPSPFDITLAVKPIADFVAEMGKGHDQATARQIAEVLATVPGKAEMRLTTTVRRRGLTLRFEVQEGILQWLAAVNPDAARVFLPK